MTLRIWGHLGQEEWESLRAHWLREMVGLAMSPLLLAREQLPEPASRESSS